MNRAVVAAIGVLGLLVSVLTGCVAVPPERQNELIAILQVDTGLRGEWIGELGTAPPSSITVATRSLGVGVADACLVITERVHPPVLNPGPPLEQYRSCHQETIAVGEQQFAFPNPLTARTSAEPIEGHWIHVELHMRSVGLPFLPVIGVRDMTAVGTDLLGYCTDWSYGLPDEC